MCMNKATAEKMLTLGKVLRCWRGSINRDKYNDLILNFAGERQNVPSWDTAKKYLQAAHLIQKSNAYTISHAYVVTDYDEGTEHWDVYRSHYYTINRKKDIPTTVEAWQALTA